jgi:hypothetical protein
VSTPRTTGGKIPAGELVPAAVERLEDRQRISRLEQAVADLTAEMDRLKGLIDSIDADVRQLW